MPAVPSSSPVATPIKNPRIPYGTDPRQFGDLFFPRGPADGALPLVVLIHGGGWMATSNKTGLDPIARDLAAHGIAVWSIEYRGSGGTGGWPHTFEDIATAIDFLPKLADASLNNHRFRLDKVAVVGHSAGGNLAAWAATRASLPAGSPGADPQQDVHLCVGMAGVYDLKLAFENHDQYVRALLGGDPTQVPDRYRLASPADNVPTSAEMVLFHGVNDRVVRVIQATRYAKRLQDAHSTVALHVMQNASHLSWGDVGSVQWAAVRKEVIARFSDV